MAVPATGTAKEKLDDMREDSEAEAKSYRVLGVRPGASIEEVRRAFRRQAILHHPDRNPGNAGADKRFREILEAYQVARRSLEWRARQSDLNRESVAAPHMRRHRAFARRRSRRSRTSIGRVLGRFFLFVAFIVGPILLMLLVFWANTTTDWLADCCWEYFGDRREIHGVEFGSQRDLGDRHRERPR